MLHKTEESHVGPSKLPPHDPYRPQPTSTEEVAEHVLGVRQRDELEAGLFESDRAWGRFVDREHRADIADLGAEVRMSAQIAGGQLVEVYSTVTRRSECRHSGEVHVVLEQEASRRTFTTLAVLIAIPG